MSPKHTTRSIRSAAMLRATACRPSKLAWISAMIAYRIGLSVVARRRARMRRQIATSPAPERAFTARPAERKHASPASRDSPAHVLATARPAWATDAGPGAADWGRGMREILRGTWALLL